MSTQILMLSLTAASIGVVHTLAGPDHYLPFVVLSKARNWNRAKVIWITALCGFGHIAGSVILGTIGIACGFAISKIKVFESVSGSITAWLFILFGLMYAIWGLRKVFQNKKHVHSHSHFGGIFHNHSHTHIQSHAHPHITEAEIPKNNDSTSTKTSYKDLTPWLLFVLFVFGPCEPLIPLFMYPAYQHSIVGIIAVTTVFGVVTIATMLSVVLMMTFGISFIRFQKFEKYTHAIAGATIFFSGIAMQFFGL